MASSHKFQSPKGTRDFPPAEMAVRRHVESIWREISIRHGFEEVDGPTYEHLELYTAKSGPGIVSELFSFRRAGGDTDYALRPEFTPTLARMVAAAGNSLARPIKWFCMPAMFRAERPQRGRLREHIQWNVDLIGDDTPRADAEVLAVMVGVLERLGLTQDLVKIRVSHRGLITTLLEKLCAVVPEQMDAALQILDRREKVKSDEFARQAAEIGIDADALARFDAFATTNVPLRSILDGPGAIFGEDAAADLAEDEGWTTLVELARLLERAGSIDWCHLDLSIVRGLAYYTGTVFEVHEASGNERAIAGGGRYDQLVELFGGAPTPAVGIAMGDVVIRLVLQDNGLLEDAGTYRARPDVFVINVRSDTEAQDRLVGDLRRRGLHTRHSYRQTKNVGKLLGEAGKTGARRAVILGSELDDGLVTVKDLEAGEQGQIALDQLVDQLVNQLGADASRGTSS